MTKPDEPSNDETQASETSEPEPPAAREAIRPGPTPSIEDLPPAGPGPRPSIEDDEDDEDDEIDDEEDDDEPRRASEPHRESRHDPRGQRRSGFEGLLRDSFRKAVERGLEVGLGTLKSADHVVRNVADEVKLPKELTNYLFTQIDETKNVLIRAVAGEVRQFLDQTDLATELQRALTALSFEVRMEIRFIPNEAGELKPNVKAKAVPRARRPERKPSARREGDE